MPKVTHLTNQHVKVEYGREKVPSEDGESEVEELTWTLVFRDRVYGDEFRVKFWERGRDGVIAQLQRSEASPVVIATRVPGGMDKL